MTATLPKPTAAMDRRRFLALAGAALALPRYARAAAPLRTLVLVQLAGGNDGLNTVVPFADPLYARLRPRLAVPRDRVLRLDHRLGLHPDLAALMPLWDAGELAVIQGVGYSPPNRSHFRSTDIWETGSDPDAVLSDGWIARVLAGAPDRARVADALVLGGSPGPATGRGLRTIVLHDPARFFRGAQRLDPAGRADGNPALAHILAVERQIREAARGLRPFVEAPPAAAAFPSAPLGTQLALAARLLAAGLTVPVVKATLPGFDTHRGQEGVHRRLLEDLGRSLAAFRRAMVASGRWRDVLVMTYSEFGRRAAENGNAGTDHGTAAPHFVLGGRVRGGLYGLAPNLADLADGDLRPGIDFRRLYAGVAERWWGLAGARRALGGLPPLPFV